LSADSETEAEDVGNTSFRGLHRRAFLLTTFAALLGILVSVSVWQVLRRNEADRIHRTTGAVAEGLAHELEARLEKQIAAARSLAGFWAAYRFTSRSRWAYDSELYARNNGFSSVARVETELRDSWVATPFEARAPAPTNPDDAQAIEAALDRAARVGVESTAGPFRIEQGGYALWLIFPVRYRDRAPALLVATMTLDSLLQRFLDARAPGYTLSVRDGEAELYRRGVGAQDTRAIGFPIELPNGMGWRGFIQPTTATLAGEETPLPEIVFAAGMLISALLAGSVWLAYVAHARAKSVAEANRRIHREVASTRSAEAALRKLNAELEARVADRTAELKELVSELEAFTYSVSHDLRSPLGAVVNFASILEEDYRNILDLQGRDYLDRISSSAHSALELMDGLLAFSRLGREELQRTRVDVRALVSDVVEEMSAVESARNARIELGALPAAKADPAMLRAVFSNLLSNALKFSRGHDRPRIEVSASKSEGETVYRVTDNGVGFDAQLAHKLFSVFERLHPKEEFEGSGIGLATAARIVRRHGGRIWAESDSGEGATFFFTLPNEEERDSHAEQS